MFRLLFLTADGLVLYDNNYLGVKVGYLRELACGLSIWLASSTFYHNQDDCRYTASYLSGFVHALFYGH